MNCRVSPDINIETPVNGNICGAYIAGNKPSWSVC